MLVRTKSAQENAQGAHRVRTMSARLSLVRQRPRSEKRDKTRGAHLRKLAFAKSLRLLVRSCGEPPQPLRVLLGLFSLPREGRPNSLFVEAERECHGDKNR